MNWNRGIRSPRHLHAIALGAALASGSVALAQLGYGVNSNGDLFSFDVQNPHNPVVPHGNLGFVPEGLDFRPGTSVLYALDVGPSTTQLYTVDTSTGVPTPVGAGFPSQVVGSYNLAPIRNVPQTFGFDFNPGSLQVDGSIRIRLVSSALRANLRLNSDTGAVASVDNPVNYGGDPTRPLSINAVAYINSNAAVIGGATTLFDMDSLSDSLNIQNPPNSGLLTVVGPFGVGFDALSNIGFDIYTDPADADPTIGGDHGYAVLRRAATANGAWLLYGVNLATGALSGGTLVGDGAGNIVAADFTGGLALTSVPESSTTAAGLSLLSLLGATIGLRRRPSR